MCRLATTAHREINVKEKLQRANQLWSRLASITCYRKSEHFPINKKPDLLVDRKGNRIIHSGKVVGMHSERREGLWCGKKFA